ncbi:MAG: hypothetical protein AAF693_12820 [Bacteroidota bacterium]
MVQAQTFDAKIYYEQALTELTAMIEGHGPASFKRAVFVTENAYFNGQLSYDEFKAKIAELAKNARFFAHNLSLIYEGKDQDRMELYAAIFNVMTGVQGVRLDSSKVVLPKPYVYDFDDFFGDRDWSKMFVTKLLDTHTGNCHSMPFLYKLIAEELEVEAYLAMAPNHTYIKLYSEHLGWYNTELTSATFPVDAWIMGSGYVHTDAVINRLYMDTLSLKQSIAVTLIDLAKGYERKGGKNDTGFLLKCANLALAHYPTYVNAMILKAETLKLDFEAMMKEAGVAYASALFDDPEAKALFDQMQALYLQIHTLGYRRMPREMYLAWLSELNEEKEKYLNKNFSNLRHN